MFNISGHSASATCEGIEERFSFAPPSEQIIDCSYYLHREVDQACGPKGYYIGFAYKYCSKLLFDKRLWIDFSSQGYVWLSSAALCLQKKLHTKRCEQTASEDQRLSCNEVEQFAFNSHVKCYTRPDKQRPQVSVCNLPLSDYPILANVIKRSFVKAKVWAQMRGVIKSCSRKELILLTQ